RWRTPPIRSAPARSRARARPPARAAAEGPRGRRCGPPPAAGRTPRSPRSDDPEREQPPPSPPRAPPCAASGSAAERYPPNGPPRPGRRSKPAKARRGTVRLGGDVLKPHPAAVPLAGQLPEQRLEVNGPGSRRPPPGRVGDLHVQERLLVPAERVSHVFP